ncbi:FAD-dependent oxidoreductase [Chloroflexota bacterium]
MEKERDMVCKEPSKGAPCQERCPAGVDVPRYNRLISQGKFQEALAVIQERIPFPSICGRVCPAPCEQACQDRHNHVGGPVSINALKRFVTEHTSVPHQSSRHKSSNKKVAVIGSGPAGLTAAYYLSKLGHKVVVMEALPVAGGMMRVGIPEYRLPKHVLDKEIDKIRSAGVEIRTNTRLNSLEDLSGQEYNAIFLALGAHKCIKLMIEGEDDPGVIDGVTFLKDTGLGRKVNLGERVAVIGGGNVAIDSARSALRLGAKEVTIVYRRTRSEMPASPEEVRAALYEGVRIIFLAAPEIISRENGTLKLECVRMELGKPDASGRPQPIPIKGSGFSIVSDSIIAAIGQTLDITSKFDLRIDKGNTIHVDSDTLATNKKGVFAGGDAVTGSASVIEAIAVGRHAASSIDKYLGGSGDIEEKLASPEEELPPLIHGPSVGERAVMPKLSLKERLSGFGEVELGFDEETAIGESTRCLWCDLPVVADPTRCVGCLRCALMCSFRFEEAFNPSYAKITIVGPDRSTPTGEPEILFADDCDGCGICVRACSYGSLDRVKECI